MQIPLWDEKKRQSIECSVESCIQKKKYQKTSRKCIKTTNQQWNKHEDENAMVQVSDIVVNAWTVEESERKGSIEGVVGKQVGCTIQSWSGRPESKRGGSGDGGEWQH